MVPVLDKMETNSEIDLKGMPINKDADGCKEKESGINNAVPAIDFVGINDLSNA